MAPRSEWTRRFLPRSSTASPSTRRLASSHTASDFRPSARRRPLPPLSVAVGAGVAALALSTSPDNARQLRASAHMGVLVIHESEVVSSFEDAMALATQWSDVLRRGGLQAAQDELVERLLSRILRLQDDANGLESLRLLIERGVVPLLVQYTASNKPTEPRRLQQLVQSLIKLLEAAAVNGQVQWQVSLLTLAHALAHLKQQDEDIVSYVDLLQLGDALLKVQQLAQTKLQEGADASRVFAVFRSELLNSDSANVTEGCAALVVLCSPEMPDSMKKFGLWGLSTLVQGVNRENESGVGAQLLEAALGPAFAQTLLSLPRENDYGDLQLQAATVLDRVLHVARQNPAAVSRNTYELWMEQIRFWSNTHQAEDSLKPAKRAWLRLKSGRIDEIDEETKMRNQKLHLQLQVFSSRCLRTLTASPQSRRYVCDSTSTRAALFELSRQVHKKKQEGGFKIDEDTAGSVMSIQRHLSWTFRNICTGFQTGATALNSLFDASWTASLLQSRRDLPMSRFFRGVSDLTDLPIVGAEEYEASTEFGWVDILTAWTASSDHQVRENAIASLVYLAEQHEPSPVGVLPEEEDTIRNKQEHILQAWLTNMLQQIRLLSGGELLAVKQMEEIANLSNELTPGNERILFNPVVVDAGTSALAVLAELHHSELVQQGVVPLVALLSATRAATPAQHTQCARVLANLVATYCLDIDPKSSALSTDPSRAVITSDHVDIGKLLEQTVSGKRFLADIRHWRECEDPMQRSNYFRVVQNLRAYDEVVATGRLVKDVYCEGVHPIVSRSTANSLENPADNDLAPVIDVVFVHGLRGHPFRTWRTDMGNKLEGANDIWPDVLLAEDLQRNNVPARLVTLGYEAGMVSWSSPWPSLTLQERGRVMLSALYAANIGRDRHHPGAPARPVVFITHSMGGLLTKKMLLLECEQRDRSGLADSTAGVVFLAVPHFGSDLAKGVRSESIRKLIQAHPAIQDLGADPNGRLKDLNDRFKKLGIDCLSMGEDRAAPVALGLSAVVVKPDSADPGTGRFYVLPESDHMTICKAKSRHEPLYQDILQYILVHAAGGASRA